MSQSRSTGGCRCWSLAAAAALVAALALQFLGGLPPCPFCVYQRYPYLVVIAVGVLGFWLRRPDPALALIALALAVNVGIAAYHVGDRAGLARTARELRRGRARHDDRGAAPAARGGAGALRSGARSRFAGLSLAAWNVVYAAAPVVCRRLGAARRLSS